MPYLTASAKAAALQCSGRKNETTCGMKWTQEKKYDGKKGVGEQMSALQVIQGLLVEDAEMTTPTSSPESPSATSTDEPSDTPTNAAALTAVAGYQKMMSLLVFFAILLV